MVRYMFLNEGARELYLDWEMAARSTVAALHRYAGRYPSDPQLAELVGELSVRDTDFRPALHPSRPCACWPAG